MKEIFDRISAECSKTITSRYSTSFSLGIKFLSPRLRHPVYAIYGFVRLADEIVDSFHAFDRKSLLEKFRHDTFEALNSRISLNPILNSFQNTVHTYNIGYELVDTFLVSMEMDLENGIVYHRKLFDKYIFGSAESVGLMCLKVFCNGDQNNYDSLKLYAMKLGAAFQKVNFLRDMKSDKELLGRDYFPGINFHSFRSEDKKQIEKEIQNDFEEALKGIRKLPDSSRAGVYLAYYYYLKLFRKIRSMPAERVKTGRIRIPDSQKLLLMIASGIRNKLNLI